MGKDFDESPNIARLNHITVFQTPNAGEEFLTVSSFAGAARKKAPSRRRKLPMGCRGQLSSNAAPIPLKNGVSFEKYSI